MKQLLFFIFLKLFIFGLFSQNIQKVLPQKPNEKDSISFEIVTSFPMGSLSHCPPLVGYTDSMKNNNLLVYDLYYDISGPWANFSCTRTDTVDYLSLLSPNNYTIIAHWHVVQDTSANNSMQMDTSARYTSDTMLFTVSSLTGINEFLQSTIQLFPNPVKEKLRVSLNSENKVENIKVMDVSGKEYQLPIRKIENRILEINVRDLSSGIYILQLKTYKVSYRKKFIKW